MDQETLQKCQELLNHDFDDPGLLKLALTHSSVAPTRLESNERLEFLGDAVLGLVVCHQLHELDENLTEGDMTKIKSSVVSRQTCAAIAEEAGISNLMRLGKGLATPDGLPTSVSAAVFESIIGAIYLDGGLEPARKFILRHVQPHIEEALAEKNTSNYKSLLQQHAQRKWGKTPSYTVLDEKGPDHSKCFEVAVSIDGRHFPSAWGMNKKDAEQQAALLALQTLQVLDVDAEEYGTA
ncbi:MAG: ribonuclease III [Phycisphaerae bacterium]